MKMTKNEMDSMICSRVTERTFKLKFVSFFQLPSDKKRPYGEQIRLKQPIVIIYCVLHCFRKFDINSGIS